MERNPFIIIRSRIQQVLIFGNPYLDSPSFRCHPADMLQNSPFRIVRLFETMKRTVPFSPSPDHASLYNLNHILILFKERLELFRMANDVFQCRTSSRSPQKLGFISKTEDRFLA